MVTLIIWQGLVGILSNLEMAQPFTVSNCRHGDLAAILPNPRSSSLFGHGALHRRWTLWQDHWGRGIFGCLRFVDEDVICIHAYGIVSRTCFDMMLNLPNCGRWWILNVSFSTLLSTNRLPTFSSRLAISERLMLPLLCSSAQCIFWLRRSFWGKFCKKLRSHILHAIFYMHKQLGSKNGIPL